MWAALRQRCPTVVESASERLFHRSDAPGRRAAADAAAAFFFDAPPPSTTATARIFASDWDAAWEADDDTFFDDYAWRRDPAWSESPTLEALGGGLVAGGADAEPRLRDA